MIEIGQLIKANIELEGILRVLGDRHSEQTEAILAEKYDNFKALMEAYLGRTDISKTVSEPESQEELKPEEITATQEEADTEEETLPEEAPAIEIKDQEAEEAEEAPALQDEAAKIVAEDAETTAPGEPNTRLLRAFTLNDRFRFRRELFNGNDSDLSDTLMILAGMESYDEAADYLLGDMMWDKNNASVADFMAILAQHMPR